MPLHDVQLRQLLHAIEDIANGITVTGTDNIAQVNGQTVNVGTGAAGTGTLRVTTSTDSTIGTLTSGNVGGFTSKVAFAPTTSATAYTANDNIGGIITLTSLLRTSGGSGLLDTVSVWLLNNAAPNLYIDFWDASPSGTYTNDAAQVIAGDQLKWLGMVEVAVSDWKQTGVISRCTVNPPKFGVKGNGSANIFMTIQDKTGVTLGSTAGMFGYVTCLQD